MPADIRRTLGLKDGDEVTMRIVDGRLLIRPYRDVIGDVQDRLRPHIPAGESLVDELIAERRVAAENE